MTSNDRNLVTSHCQHIFRSAYAYYNLDKIHHKKSTKRQIWASLPDVWLAAPWLVQAATGSLGLFRLSRSLKQKSRDHSIKTWTKSFTILTPYPIDWTIVDILQFYLPFVHLTMHGLSFNHLLTYLPTSSYPCSYWMTHYRLLATLCCSKALHGQQFGWSFSYFFLPKNLRVVRM